MEQSYMVTIRIEPGETPMPSQLAALIRKALASGMQNVEVAAETRGKASD